MLVTKKYFINIKYKGGIKMSHWLRYIIYWDKWLIGKIYEKDGKYRYYPNYDNIEEAEKAGLPRAIYINPQLEWGEMPTFFKDRLAQDPDCINMCRNITDLLFIKKESPKKIA